MATLRCGKEAKSANEETVFIGLLCHRAGRNVFYLSVRSSVRPFVCYQTCEYDILKTNELILIQIRIGGRCGKGMKGSTSGVSRSKVTLQSAEAIIYSSLFTIHGRSKMIIIIK